MIADDGYLVALDAGIGGGRCLVVGSSGAILGSAYREWGYTTPPDVPGGCVFDPPAFWETLCAVTREALASAGVTPAGALAVSATAMREGIILLDAAGTELHGSPPQDHRGAEYAASLRATAADLIFSRSGRLPWAGHAPGILDWYRRHRPALFERVATVLTIADWMLFRLSGERVGQPSAACASLLLDVARRDWSPELLALYGLDPALCPRVVEAGSVVGRLTAEAARACGLPAGLPVVAAGGDAQCGALGAGAASPGVICAVAGTTTPVLLTTPACQIDGSRRLVTRCHARPDHWILEANAGITGLSLRRLRDVVRPLLGLDERTASFDALVACATTVPIGANGVHAFIGPHVAGRDWNGRSAPNAVLGLDLTHRRQAVAAELVRAAMEATCYAVAANARLLAEVGGAPLELLAICGGQAPSAVWCQIQADVLGTPVLAAGVREATAFGAAVCAGIGVGVFAGFDDPVTRRVPGRRYEPDPSATAQYAPLGERWIAEYGLLATLGRAPGTERGAGPDAAGAAIREPAMSGVGGAPELASAPALAR